jgi:hypothetical protein
MERGTWIGGKACFREYIRAVAAMQKIRTVGRPDFFVDDDDDDEGEHCSTVVLVLLPRRRERGDAIVRELDYNIYIY